MRGGGHRRGQRWLASLLALLLVGASALLTVGLVADPAAARGSATVEVDPRLQQELGSLKDQLLTTVEGSSLRRLKVPGPSPAETIGRFRRLTDQAETRIREAVRRGLAEPGPFFSPAVVNEVDQAVAQLQQATDALDLSRVPVALRPMSGVATLLMLRSLLRYDLSQSQQLKIPDLARVQRERLTTWTIPDTAITLNALSRAQAQQGQACRRCSVGDFLFSAETLDQVPDDFAQVFTGRYRLQLRFGADLFSYWALLPGGALPPKLFLSLPVGVRRLLLTPISGQSLLQWLLLVPVTLLAMVAMGWWIWRLRRWQRQRPELSGLGSQLLGLLAVLPLLLLVWGWQWFAIDWINLIGAREAAVLVIVRLLQGLLLAMLAYLGAEAAGQLITTRSVRDAGGAVRHERRKGSGQILTIARLFGVLAALALLIQTGQDLGLTAFTLLGLVSVPALAISLGTQQLIRDIADGFSLLLDGQLRSGDRCTIGTRRTGFIKGKIASLGMRSLRIQQDDGSMLSMPNSQVAGSVVVNHRFTTSTPLKLSLPIADELLCQLPALLEDARRLLAASPQLRDAKAELEATDQGWCLSLKGSWPADLPKAELSATQEQLYLQLIALTHQDSDPAGQT